MTRLRLLCTVIPMTLKITKHAPTFSHSEAFYWVPYHAVCFAPFWLLCFLMGSTTSVADVIIETARYYISPKYSDAVREVEHSPKSGLPCDGSSGPEPDLPEGDGSSPSLNPIQTSQHGFSRKERDGGGEVRLSQL